MEIILERIKQSEILKEEELKMLLENLSLVKLYLLGFADSKMS